jgi:hypothetical protein
MRFAPDLEDNMARGLANVVPLTGRLKKGAESGHEFARIISVLARNQAQLRGWEFQVPNDESGDYQGVDAFSERGFGIDDRTGFSIKFVPSPLKQSHKGQIRESLRIAISKASLSKIKRWVLITPENFRTADYDWLKQYAASKAAWLRIEQWGHIEIVDWFLHHPGLCGLYYPEIYSTAERGMREVYELTMHQLTNVLGPIHGRLTRLQNEVPVLSDEYCQYMPEEYYSELPDRPEVKEIVRVFESHIHLVFESDLIDALTDFSIWANRETLPDKITARYNAVMDPGGPGLSDGPYATLIRSVEHHLRLKQQIIQAIAAQQLGPLAASKNISSVLMDMLRQQHTP